MISLSSSRQTCVSAVLREVIMFLLRHRQRKGKARGRADAAAEWPNTDHRCTFGHPIVSSSERRDNDDSSVLTRMRSLLQPEGNLCFSSLDFVYQF